MIGSLGFQEILLILAVALLIFGPRELPKIGRTIGRTLAEFRKASNDLRRSLNAELLEEELRQNDPRKLVKDTVDDLKSAAVPDDREPPAASASADRPQGRGRPDAGAASAGTGDDASPAPQTGGEGPATVARGTSPAPAGSAGS